MLPSTFFIKINIEDVFNSKYIFSEKFKFVLNILSLSENKSIFNNIFKFNNININLDDINKNLDRIKFVDRLSVDDFINLSGNSNVLLDPVYFGSGNSFIETFSYGTPMVTFPSNFLRSRLVMGLYNQMKINNTPIVYNNEDYINLSIELANNRKLNEEIRGQIIENSNKYFFNNYLVINEFENFFISLMNNNGQEHR